MSMQGQHRQCPHCGEALRPFALPDSSGWEAPIHWACFNDDCSYFRRGWGWMKERFGVRASYRYRLDPVTGKDFPLAVWSPAAVRDRILGDGVPGRPEISGQAPAGAAR